MFLRPSVLFLLSSNVSFALASLAMTSTGCADPAGFDKCWAATNNEAATLFNAHCTTGACTDSDNCYSPDAYCAEAVMCLAYTAWINCALSTCWNRVYGCEYQNLAINAVQACPIANHFAPYVPAPHDAPGYCSCNMGFVYDAHLNENRDGDSELYACENNGKTKVLNGCVCCAASSATSTFYNSCPSTDPSEVPIFPLLGYDTLITSTCSTVLGEIGVENCAVAPYGFTISPGPTYSGAPANEFFSAATLPKNGTQPLSNNPGGPSTPVSGAVITWSLYNGGTTVASASVTTWNPSSSTTSSKKTTSSTKTTSSSSVKTSSSTLKTPTTSSTKTTSSSSVKKTSSSTLKTSTTSTSKKSTSMAKTTTTLKKARHLQRF